MHTDNTVTDNWSISLFPNFKPAFYRNWYRHNVIANSSPDMQMCISLGRPLHILRTVNAKGQWIYIYIFIDLLR